DDGAGGRDAACPPRRHPLPRPGRGRGMVRLARIPGDRARPAGALDGRADDRRRLRPVSESEHLKRAYSLRTPGDSVALYRDWAESYDETFARAHGYVAPREVARVFRAVAGAEDRPVL